MPKVTSHIHRLKRHRYPSGNAVFFCTLPDCHYKLDVPLALGKRTLCNICGAEFVMNEYTIKLGKPHCSNCGKIKVKDAEGNSHYVKKIASNILTGVAIEANRNLRSRLENVTSNSLEDDI